MTLNRIDDKRVIDDDQIRTHAYEHYALRVSYYIVYIFIFVYIHSSLALRSPVE